LQLITNLFSSLYLRLTARGQDEEEGQTLVEYGLIVALLSIVLIAVLVTLADNLETVFQDVATCLSDPPACA
jgi:pilus assembly protein Flp/PilA